MGSQRIERTRNVVRAVVGRELLAAASEALGAEAIALAPLKGAYLQARVYASPEERPITDVDVLVPEACFGQARRVLVARGWQWTPVNASEAVARSPDHGLPLDVHRRLFLPGEFDLSTDAVFARAAHDTTRAGLGLWWPDPMDVFAHLVGHFVKSRAGAEDAMYLDDLEQLALAETMDAVRCAQRLHDVGMGRAARYTLHYGSVRAPAGFCAGVLGALASDTAGDVLAALVRRIGAHAAKGAPRRALPGIVLERSLSRAGLALLRRAGAWGAPR